MDEEWIGTVEQDGLVVAEVYAATEREVVREIAHYAMMYGQDGPVTCRITPPKSEAA